MATATLATVEAYLTAAQTAFDAGDYTETRKQIILGEIELNKLIVSDGLDGESTTYRQTFKSLRTAVEDFENKGGRGTRRSIAEPV